MRGGFLILRGRGAAARRISGVVAVAGALCFCAGPGAERAQAQSGAGLAAEQADLAQRQADAEAARSARETAAEGAALRAEQARADRVQLAEDLSILGRSIVSRETALEDARLRLAQLRREVAGARVRASDSRRRLQALLAQIQRAAREPTPSLLAHPSRPVDAARSAILMRAMTEAHAREQAAHRRHLADIASATEAAQTLESTARAEIVALREDEKAVRALLDAKARDETVARTEAERAAAEAAALAQRTRSLSELAEALERQAARREAEAAAQRAAAQTAQSQETRRLERREAARREARAGAGAAVGVGRFAEARGRVLAPAAGHVARPSGAGGGDRRRAGVFILTPPHSRVIAPWSGRVRYAGDFHSEGKLVIVEPEEGYALLLSGLSSVETTVGAYVSAGEPIGRMGGRSRRDGDFLFEWSGEAETDAAQQRLYFEILRNGDPVDPAPWLQRQTKRVSGL